MPKQNLENELPDDDDERDEGEEAARPAARNGRPDSRPADRRPRPERRPAPVVEEVEEEEPETYEHPPALVRLARHLGFTKQQIDETPSADLLFEVKVRREERAAQAPRPKAEEKPAEKPAERDDVFELEHEIEVRDPVTGEVTGKRKATLDDYDPAVRAVIVDNRALKKKLADREKADEEKERRSLFSMMDDGFEALGNAARYGVGTIEELAAAGETDAIARRNAVASVSGVTRGDSQRVVDRKLRAADERLYGKGTKKPAAEEAAEAEEYGAPRRPKKKTRAERWEESQVARPRGRRGPPTKGRNAVLSEIDRILEAEGLDPGPRRSHHLEDELPGDDDDI